MANEITEYALAFPTPLDEQLNAPQHHDYLGLTKREYFAARAMQGLLSDGAFGGTGSPKIAAWAVDQADELIKALNNNS